MSDRRHCDQKDCKESTSQLKNDHPWKAITWLGYDGDRYWKHFCSIRCLSQFAIEEIEEIEEMKHGKI